MTGPFILLNGRDLLYPQSSLYQKVDKFIAASEPWAADEAAKLLAEHASPSSMVHPTCGGDDKCGRMTTGRRPNHLRTATP